MGRDDNKIQLPAPLLCLALIEAAVFACMPYLSTYIISRDLPGVAAPSASQTLAFTLALVGAGLLLGLYRQRRNGHRGDLVRSAWAFTLAGATIAFTGAMLPGSTLRLSVAVLALLIGFFVQRTLRLVFFDAVQVPGHNGNPGADRRLPLR